MSFSSVGIGSGLKVDEMVAQLVALEKKPLVQLQTQASTINARVSAFSQLKSQISNLQDQVTKLTTAATWEGKTLTSANTTVVTGTASAKAANGTFDVSVKQLAAGQAIGSESVPKDATFGTGSLTIKLGTWSGATLQANDPPVEVAVQITDQENTLAKIAAKINQSNAGVTATVLSDHTGERLSLQSNATGANAAFSVDIAQTTGTGLEKFAYAGGAGVAGSMQRSREAIDTKAEVNGITLFSRNNTFTNVAEGVNLTVSKAMADTETPVRITIQGDTATAKSALKNLVDSYNALSGAVSAMTAYDPNTKTAGTLQGDSTAVNLQSALRRALSNTGGEGGAFRTLSQIGLTFQKDGTLKIDDTKLDAALKDPDSMVKFFAADLPDANKDGWAVRLKDFTSGLLSSNGMFATKDSSLKDSLKRNTKDQDRVNERAAQVEKRLLAQYTRLDMQMGNLTALNNYVSQQVTAWNNQKN